MKEVWSRNLGKRNLKVLILIMQKLFHDKIIKQNTFCKNNNDNNTEY